MSFFRLLHEILREIFDEAAYERFCAREALTVGSESYALFLTRSEKRVKPRCC